MEGSGPSDGAVCARWMCLSLRCKHTFLDHLLQSIKEAHVHSAGELTVCSTESCLVTCLFVLLPFPNCFGGIIEAMFMLGAGEVGLGSNSGCEGPEAGNREVTAISEGSFCPLQSLPYTA